MFTIADIRNIAIQIELNGEKTYRKAGEECTDPTMAKIFAQMAEDEKRHAKWFESIRSEKPLTEEQREMEAMGRTLLQEMVGAQTFSLEQNTLNKVSNIEELLQQSQGFEQDTIQFYELLSGFIEDSDTMQQLETIIHEERSHLAELGNLLNSMMAEL
jgi:rubrerythrin